MAESDAEPGAPIAKDAIDPDLIKLARARPKIGLVTSAGLVFLCGLFVLRIAPDRRFGGSSETPQHVEVSAVLAGTAPLDRFVQLTGVEPLYSHAIRTAAAQTGLGSRVVPVRGTGDRLWLALSGDGWDVPTGGAYAGRLRALADLPFAKTLTAYAAAQPQPMFATIAALRAGAATGTVQAVTGEALAVGDADKLAFDVIDPDASTVIGTFTDDLPDAHAWAMALVGAGVAADGAPETTKDSVRYHVLAGVADTKAKLDAPAGSNTPHGLLASRVEPVTRHYETTWSDVRRTAGSVTIGTKLIPDAEIDLVGIYVARGIPANAVVLLSDDRPTDYWWALPVTIAVALIGLLFAWALARAIKDVLPAGASVRARSV